MQNQIHHFTFRLRYLDFSDFSAFTFEFRCLSENFSDVLPFRTILKSFVIDTVYKETPGASYYHYY